MTSLDAIAKAIQHADTQAKIRWIETGDITDAVFVAMARAALRALGLREIVEQLVSHHPRHEPTCLGCGLLARLRPLLAEIEKEDGA